eukprot:TRINITY_DN3755_c0_g1_i26.p1 TRINITY_DN3755_c0_g1~~TRINITY_DN3755_c0_g1_i26.p1  ORF type:complete len:389 (-),score=68.60 TRINITY_DN3755_c0_g1_i26:71-1237(-)
MLAELVAAKQKGLRHATTKDTSKPVTKDVLQPLDENVYHNTILDFNIEAWVDVLGDDTTPHTEYLPIDLECARKFLQAYEILEENKQPSLPPELQAYFDSLEGKLQATIEKVRGTQDCVFIKTSSRSAKNTIGSNLSRLYDQELEAYKLERGITTPTLNDKLISLLRAGTQQMKITNAKQCIEIFYRSERIHGDFEIAMKVPERWCENFVIRKWTPMDCIMEFRTWVVNGKVSDLTLLSSITISRQGSPSHLNFPPSFPSNHLQTTAISQYSNLIVNPVLVENSVKIKKELLNFFTTHVKDQLAQKYTHYVVDYGFEPGSLDRVWVVEVNPFMPTTGSVLFDWAKDADLLNGKLADSFDDGCDFRFRTEAPLGILADMIPEWKAIIEK